MVSGMEVAGLALAVLPLFIEVAKTYSDGVEAISDVVIKSRWEDHLEYFYLGFYIQLFYVEEIMKKLREVVPVRSEAMQLISEWYCEPQFEYALKEYFQSEDRFRIFTTICRKILDLLSQLVKDKSNRVCPKDQTSQAMFKKLIPFANATQSTAIKSTFIDRFVFFRHDSKRTKCLGRLEKYNARANLYPLDKLCDAFSAHRLSSVSLLVEDSRDQKIMGRLGFRSRRLVYFDQCDPISLRELLEGPTKLGPIEKRRLALIFAESLLLYHDSEWLQPGWVKDDIYFFFKAEEDPDLDRPFLSARLNIAGSGNLLSGSLAYHANPSILALGILLIEIFNERAIEKWKTAKERSGSNPVTLQMVADRVVNKMDSSGSTKAIQACLYLDWIPAGRSAGLDNAETRTGFWKNVIWPVKQELQYLSTNKTF